MKSTDIILLKYIYTSKAIWLSNNYELNFLNWKLNVWYEIYENYEMYKIWYIITVIILIKIIILNFSAGILSLINPHLIPQDYMTLSREGWKHTMHGEAIE